MSNSIFHIPAGLFPTLPSMQDIIDEMVKTKQAAKQDTQTTKPAKPNCPFEYRVITYGEFEQMVMAISGGMVEHELEENIRKYGGYTTPNAAPSPHLYDTRLFLRFGGEVVAFPDWAVTKTQVHSFVDTGTRWSYCRVCDCDGYFDATIGKFCAQNH